MAVPSAVRAGAGVFPVGWFGFVIIPYLSVTSAASFIIVVAMVMVGVVSILYMAAGCRFAVAIGVLLRMALELLI